jgi:hypothetical protein
MSEIVPTFDHLFTQLDGLKVKVSKCKLWSPSKISSNINIPQVCILVTYGLCILGVSMGSQDFVTHFLDGALFQDVAHIDDLPFLVDTHVALGILSSCVTC